MTIIGTPVPVTPADTTLAALRTAIRLQLPNSVDWPDLTLNSYIADAIRAYSNEFPSDNGYTIPSADSDEIPVPVGHWEALVAFVDFRAHWQLSATEAAEITSNSIVLSQLSTVARMAWNRYKEVIDRITWRHLGQSGALTWDMADEALDATRIY